MAKPVEDPESPMKKLRGTGALSSLDLTKNIAEPATPKHAALEKELKNVMQNLNERRGEF